MKFTETILVDGMYTKAFVRVENFRYGLPLSTKVEVGSVLVVGKRSLEVVSIGQASNHLLVEVKKK